MQDADLLLGFGLLFLAAALARVVTPRQRAWNNSRAATQRDVADVLAGRGKKDGRVGEVTIFALLLMVGVVCYAAVM